MLSRALILATVTLLIGCFAADPVLAQATNLEAGKSPSQIFAGTCNACHKSPRGLLKTVPAGSLQGFLRQHYTTSPEMASLLTAFLISNGANDPHYVGNQAKPGKDEKPDARPSGLVEQLDRFGRRLRPGSPEEAARPEAEPREATKPDADGLSEPGRHGRNAKRLARPEESPAAEGQVPAQATNERGPDGRKLSAKQKLSKRGKPGAEELPKAESAKTEPAKTETGKEEPAKGEAAKEDAPRSDTAKVESGKTEGSKPSGEGKSDSAKSDSAKSDAARIEPPKETGGGDTPALRPDPVPSVTPAPPASPSVSAAVSNAPPEPTLAPSVPAPAAPTMTATAPPPVAPAGPPAPPISQ
jgi:hypothetical protein